MELHDVAELVTSQILVFNKRDVHVASHLRPNMRLNQDGIPSISPGLPAFV